MNNQTIGAVGITAAIELIKNDIYQDLSDLWNDTFDAFGRAYKLSKKPHHYVGDKEYKEILFNDEKCVMFFQVGNNDSTEDSLVYRSASRIVFMVNMDLAYPNSTIRSDGEVQRDVVEVLRENAHERFQITGIERDPVRIFTGLDQEIFKNFNDQPYFTFAVEIDLDYYLTDKC